MDRPASPPRAVLAVDHGTRRTGFALADALRIAVRPLEVISAAGDSEELVQHTRKLVEEYGAGVVLVGLPLHADGREGGRAKDVRAFLARLGEALPRDVVIWTWDEHLSTKEAEARLVEAGHTGEARKARRDSWSAWVLLEDWIRAGEPASP